MKKKLLIALTILTSLTSIGAASYISEQLNKLNNLKEISNIESENHYSYKEIVSRLKDPKLLAYAVDGEESEQYFLMIDILHIMEKNILNGMQMAIEMEF